MRNSIAHSLTPVLRQDGRARLVFRASLRVVRNLQQFIISLFEMLLVTTDVCDSGVACRIVLSRSSSSQLHMCEQDADTPDSLSVIIMKMKQIPRHPYTSFLF